MSTTLVLTPTTVSQVDNYATNARWLNPSLALVNDSNFSTAFMNYSTTGQGTATLRLTGFNIAELPASFVVDALSVTVKRKASVADKIQDAVMGWDGNGSSGMLLSYTSGSDPEGSPKWSATEETIVLDTSKWSFYWTPSVIKSNDLAIFIHAQTLDPLFNGWAAINNAFFTIDYHQVFNDTPTSAGSRCGGSATVAVNNQYNETPANSLASRLSGVSAPMVTYEISATGEAKTTGEVIPSVYMLDVYAEGVSTSGGLVSGDVFEIFGIFQAIEGGGAATGEYDAAIIYSVTTEGGLAATGESEQFIAYSTEGSGVIASGGDAAVAIHIIPTGGIMIAGSASETVVYNEQFSGSALSGGELVIQLTYAAPPIFGAALLGGRGIRVHIKNLVFYHESMILKMKSPNRYNQPKPRTDRIMGNNPTNPNVRSNPFSQDTPSKWALAGDSDRSGWVATITKNRQGEFMPPKV